MSKYIISLRKLLYRALGILDAFLGRTSRTTILAYHGISSQNWYFDISVKDFQLQILELKKQYQFISMEELEHRLKNPEQINTRPAMVLTFDDGYENILSVVEFLKTEKINPTVFVIADPKKANTKELGINNKLLSISQIKKLISYGWAIGCHSMTHPDFSSLSKQELDKEVSGAKKLLESKLNTKIKYFAFPKGVYSNQIVSQIKKSGFSLAVSMDDGKVTASNIYNLPRVGVDRSHSISEVMTTVRPSVVAFRGLIKKSLLKNIIHI